MRRGCGGVPGGQGGPGPEWDAVERQLRAGPAPGGQHQPPGAALRQGHPIHRLHDRARAAAGAAGSAQNLTASVLVSWCRHVSET